MCDTGRNNSLCRIYRRSRRGFTLIELMVVLVILGLLLSISLPAVHQARKTARALQCRNQIRQLALAVSNYESAYSMLPAHASDHGGLFVILYPYYVNDKVPVLPSDPNDLDAYMYRWGRPPILACPEPNIRQWGITTYAGNLGFGIQVYGYNGAFQPLDAGQNNYAPRARGGPLRTRDFSDGLTTTAMLSEYIPGVSDAECFLSLRQVSPALDQPDQLHEFQRACRATCQTAVLLVDRDHPWWGGDAYNHVLPPNSASCTNGTRIITGAMTATSFHTKGAHVAFQDGSVKLMSENIDSELWGALGTRNGGEVIAMTD